MICANLPEFPSPSSSKIGWPWTEQTEGLPKRMSDDSELPRISIVTPSYNQGQFIEETIRSVLLQCYPNLEYIIIDGGSTDNSVEIIKKYDKWITYWVSEPDRGQAHAIQKGFNLCTGIIWNWLNSDDILEPNSLYEIAITAQRNYSATIYSGKLTVFGQGKPFLYTQCFQRLSELVCVWEKWPVPQPAVFLSKKSCLEVHGLNTSLHYGMDYDLYLRLAQLPQFNVENINVPVARIRRHPHSKTVSQQVNFRHEIIKIFDEFAAKNPCILPDGWKKSRFLFEYISALKLNSDVGQNSLAAFLKKSTPYIKNAWKYRYFWGALYRCIKQSI